MRVLRLLALASVLFAVPSSAQAKGTVELPVTFQVQNTNTSHFPCTADGAAYTVHGHLIGPRVGMYGPGPREVTFYLQGFDSAEWNWRFQAVPGYDYGAELAQLGHVSLTIDQVGYGKSGFPPGASTCFGSQADIAHQIIGQLRSGSYSADGAQPPTFANVVLAGHDIGGDMAQIEAYSYGDVNGLMLFTWQDQGFTPYIILTSENAGMRCDAGGEEAYPGGPGFYVYFPKLEDWPMLMSNSEPAVEHAAVLLRDRNPCGFVLSAVQSATTNNAIASTGAGGVGDIKVPVILALGADDPVFTADGFAQQAQHFSSSPDVTSFLMAHTGHFEMLDRNAPHFRAITSEWLTTRGFVSKGVCPVESDALLPTDAKELGRARSLAAPSLPAQVGIGLAGLGPIGLGAASDQLASEFRWVSQKGGTTRFCTAGAPRVSVASSHGHVTLIASRAVGHHAGRLRPGAHVPRWAFGLPHLSKHVVVARHVGRRRLLIGFSGRRIHFLAAAAGTAHAVRRNLRRAHLR